MSGSWEQASLGGYLRKLREGNGFTLRAAADLAGVSNSYLSQIEGGRVVVPSVPVLDRIAKAYGTTALTIMRVTGLLERDGEEPVAPAGILEGLTEAETVKVMEYVAFLRWQRGRS